MKFRVSGYIANQDSGHLTPRIADERDRPVAYVLQPEHAKLLAAAPTMYAFIEKKAEDGDEEAKKLIGAIHATL